MCNSINVYFQIKLCRNDFLKTKILDYVHEQIPRITIGELQILYDKLPDRQDV